MLTRSETTYLILTVAFLAAGSGIKAWRRASIDLGPFPDSATLARDSAAALAAPDTLENPMADGSSAPARADSAAPPAVKFPSTDPSPRAPAASRAKAEPIGKVDLNRADAATLARVKGIGGKTAQAILDYRRAHGAFKTLRDLLQVKGIGEKKLEKLAPYLIL